MSANNGFQFLPRSEAHAMAWEDLLPPVQRAVRDLLVRLKGAEQAANADDAASCFLVYGTRGTGKTTVLYSIKHAICPDSRCKNKQFFDFSLDKKRTPAEQSLKEDAERCAESLKNTLWLDILDLEALPPKNNLLTTLLTRVRNALDSPDCDKKENPLISPFEEAADSARQQLNSLINDATLMWEDICETDTRSRANREVAAADIYANFRRRFEKAINKLSSELGKSQWRGEAEHVSIVLPIDNIDRSTDHLRSIVKLAQLVSHRRLWLILAGDREDTNTFLERAYWIELIHNEHGMNAQGKNGLWNEDETFVMARRQAAASIQKLFPQSHRIEIDLVSPLDTLIFSPFNGQKTTFQLLRQIAVPTSEEQRRIKKESDTELDQESKIKLLDLFYAKYLLDSALGTIASGSLVETAQEADVRPVANMTWISEKIVVQEPYFVHAHLEYSKGSMVTTQPDSALKKEYLTRAAQHGLHLSARGVLDLWQLAYSAAYDRINGNDFSAEKIARTMLRSAISISDMSHRVSKVFQEDIIRRTDKRGTLLFFGGLAILWDHIISERFSYVVTRKAVTGSKNSPVTRSELCVNSVEDVIYTFQNSKQTKQKNDEWDEEELPNLAAAWMTVLYDILLLAESKSGSVVINGAQAEECGKSIVTISHSTVLSLSGYKSIDLRWPMPAWDTFFAHNVFRQKWLSFRLFMEDFIKSMAKVPGYHDVITELLVSGWIAHVLATFSALSANPGQYMQAILPCINDIALIESWANSAHMQDANAISRRLYQNSLMAAEILYQRILEHELSHHRNPNVVEGVSSMRQWLENQLPLLLSNLYTPMNMDIKSAHKRGTTILTCFQSNNRVKPKLVEHWENNKVFITDSVSEKIEKLFLEDTSSDNAEESNKIKRQPFAESAPEMLWALGPLASILGINEPQIAEG